MSQAKLVAPCDVAPHTPTALVIGATRGVGPAITRRLIDDGYRVALWDTEFACFDARTEGIEPLLQQQVDLSDLHSVEAAHEDLIALCGAVDVIVNNAGVSGPTLPTWDYSLEAWQQVLDVNLSSVFHVCRTAIPVMKARGYGRIVNVSSMSGREGEAYKSAYAAATAGVIAYSKSVAKEVADSGVLINCIAPPIAGTDLLCDKRPGLAPSALEKKPMGRFLRVAEIAAMVSFIASPACGFTTGFVFDITGAAC